MTDTGSPADRVDLDALYAFLLSDRAPENSMDLSDIDGFLTAIVIGPELIMPSEWLPVIWDGEEPHFANANEAQTVIGTIMARYNEIISDLEADPVRFEPVFPEDPDGRVIVEGWAAGFLEAVRLRADAWDPLLMHSEAQTLIVPIFLIDAGDEADSVLEDPLPPGAMQQLLEHGEEIITACVVGTRSFWLERRAKPAQKPRRNRRGPDKP